MDVLVIGAGQAGLSIGRELKNAGYTFTILEARNSPGARWREHYDSLELFTPRKYSALKGMPFEGDQKGYARKDELADYLETYAKDLPVVANATVTRLTKEGEEFVAETTQGTYRARAVVVATGYAVPSLPSFAGKYEGISLHSSAYKNPSQIPEGKVLVVGGGNSGAQIAVELSMSHTVDISLHRLPRTIPRRILGISFYWWTHFFAQLPADSFLGKVFRQDKDFVVGKELLHALEDGRVARRPGVKDAEGTNVVFEDESRGQYACVIWATGFAPDYSWIAIPRALEHHRGVSAVDGLYFAGLRNQVSLVSSNIYGAPSTAAYIVKQLRRA